MTPDLLRQLLAPGWETRTVECKARHTLEKTSWLTHKVLRACLGFANEPGGGYVVVGIAEDAASKSLLWQGFAIGDPDLSTWTHDTVGERLRHHADPTPRVEVHRVDVEGKVYIVIQVFEFDDLPVLCAQETQKVKDPQGRPEVVLERGALYIRGAGKAETRTPQEANELRRVLDLALKKGLTRFVADAHAAGLTLGEPGPSADDQYTRQIRPFTESPSPLLQSIRDAQNGRWRIGIAPTRFRERRVPRLVELENSLNAATLRQGGYAYFPIHRERELDRQSDSIGAGIAHTEWRLFQSGLFVQWSEMREAWDDADHQRYLGLGSVVMMCTAAHHFASRLAVSPLGDARMSVNIGLDGIAGVQLTKGGTSLFFAPHLQRVSTTPNFDLPFEYAREELVGDWQQLARRAVNDVTNYFGGTQIPEDSLRFVQQEYLKEIV